MEDLELAAKVHYNFLPEDYEDQRVAVAVTLRPLFIIGGDYCSVLPLDENHILICTCDAVGHGIAAALFAARINTYVLTHADVEVPPCELVEGLNSYLCKRLGGTGIYASFYAMLLDFEEGTLSFTGAAHPPVLQLCSDKTTCRQWPSYATYLGVSDPMPLDCSSECLTLSSGQRFLLYSDGLIEAQRDDGEFYGIERLSESLEENSSLTGQNLNLALIEESERFSQTGFEDDVLLISITIK